MASNVYDAIIIGGGHNGLTAGAYFARAGARTVVLEGRHKTGGAADTSAPFPDHPEINVTTYSYVMSLMPPTIINELKLKRFGYDVTPFGPYFQAFPDGRAITVYADDAKKSYDSIAQFSKRDADALEEWEQWMKGVADVLGPLLIQPPPKVGSMAFGDLLASAKAAWQMRKLGVRGVGDVTRLFTMSVNDLLSDWFESDAVKAMLTVNGVIGTWAGPDEPGTAYVMLHHSIGDVGDGHLGSWGFQQGGMGGVSDAIRRSAEHFGTEIRTNAKVQKIIVRSGRAVGVVLEDAVHEGLAHGDPRVRLDDDNLPALPGKVAPTKPQPANPQPANPQAGAAPPAGLGGLGPAAPEAVVPGVKPADPPPKESPRAKNRREPGSAAGEP